MADDALDGFTETEFTHDGVTQPVYRGGSGPGVVVIHEIPGITPTSPPSRRELVDAGLHGRDAVARRRAGQGAVAFVYMLQVVHERVHLEGVHDVGARTRRRR